MTEKQFTVRHLEDANVDVIWSEKTKAIPLGYTGALVLCDLLNELVDENEQLKQVISEFVENPTQHNLWKLRTVLKDGDVE